MFCEDSLLGTLDCLTKPPRRLIKGRALLARLYHQGKHDEVRYHPGKKVYQHDSHGSTETSICGSFKPRLACALQRTHTPAFLRGDQLFRVDQRVRNKLNQRIVVRSLEAIQIPRAHPATQKICRMLSPEKLEFDLFDFPGKITGDGTTPLDRKNYRHIGCERPRPAARQAGAANASRAGPAMSRSRLPAATMLK